MTLVKTRPDIAVRLTSVDRTQFSVVSRLESGHDLAYWLSVRGLSVGGALISSIVFRSGTPEPLFSISAYLMSGGRQYDVAPDGDRFIFLQATGQSSDVDFFTGLIFVENWFEELKARVPIN